MQTVAYSRRDARPRRATAAEEDAVRVFEFDLPADVSAGAVARRHVDAVLDDGVAPATRADVKLVTTELVNNAVVHGQGAVRMRLELRPGHVLVEVIDEGTDPSAVRRREPDATGRRGLNIVDTLSARWGVFEGTTHVWCEVPLAAAPR